MNVQNTEARNVFIERSEQGVSAVPVILARVPPARAGAYSTRIEASRGGQAKPSQALAWLGEDKPALEREKREDPSGSYNGTSFTCAKGSQSLLSLVWQEGHDLKCAERVRSLSPCRATSLGPSSAGRVGGRLLRGLLRYAVCYAPTHVP